MPSAAEECREPSGNCRGISHCLESGHPLYTVHLDWDGVVYYKCVGNYFLVEAFRTCSYQDTSKNKHFVNTDFQLLLQK